jgi:uncharacterized protein (DUF58 family)
MTSLADHLPPEDINKIAHLQVLARLVVEGTCTGLHRSPHKGFSVEFKEHRQYVPGDDLRHLDWRIFGKTDRFYVREYEQETNLRCTILLDASGSMGYTGTRSGSISKHLYATRLAAAFTYLMLQQSDSVGLVIFDDGIRNYLPCRNRPAHLTRMLSALANSHPGGETALAEVFHQMTAKLHRRGLLIILTDAFDDVPRLMRALAHFRHAHHELILFQIWDRDELDFPFQQWTRFECLEASGRRHLVDPAQVRAAYLANLDRFREQLRDGCGRHRIDLVPLTTDQPYGEALARYLALRKKATARTRRARK